MRLLYLLTIAAANVLTAKFNPLILAGGLVIVPVGSLLAGMVFMLRDFVQIKHGRRKTYLTILAAIGLSAVLSAALGDTAHVAVASAISFFVSEAIDTEVFTKLRKSTALRILWSGLAGSIVDSALFVIVGLSPAGAAMLTWEQVPYAIAGQAIFKAAVQCVACVVLALNNANTR